MASKIPIVSLQHSLRSTRQATSDNRQISAFCNSILLVLIINLSFIRDSLQQREGVSITRTSADLASALQDNTDDEHTLDISMPGVRPTKNDHYLCTALNIESYGTQYVHRFEPNAHADRAHHMLLYTCDHVSKHFLKDGWWDCDDYLGCTGQRIMYAWAKNAEATTLPKDVGFRIGPEFGVNQLLLQIHYAHPLPEGSIDRSGFTLHFSSEEPKYLAGIMLLARSTLDLPPHQEKIHGNMNCALQATAPIHPFAYRVHTHKLGVVVSGYRVDPNSEEFEQIGKGNPQWPQAFYPTKTQLTINPMDYVVAQCTFSTLNSDKFTQIGGTANDEMCNLYIMYYTASRQAEDFNLGCGDEEYPEISENLPMDSDVALPRNKSLEDRAMGHHGQQSGGPGSSVANGLHYDFEVGVDGGRVLELSEYKAVSTWPDKSVVFGQASGVDFDTAGNIVLFHRGDRVWDDSIFDSNNHYNHKKIGPIKNDTVLIIDPLSGRLVGSWGRDIFYMPHDITVDKRGNFWMTDVALHQVFKFAPGQLKPSMVLGKRFQPGSDHSHFCKPAAVSVMSTGDFFVADGYCNSRVIKFNSRGEKIMEWGKAYQPDMFAGKSFWLPEISPPPYAFQIPHALALAQEHDMLCVADRENGRIQCFKASNGDFLFTIESLEFGGKLYSVAYSPANGGTLVAVNGPGSDYFSSKIVQGFVIPLATRQISSIFKPDTGFGIAHDVAISHDGNDIYVVEISEPYKIWKFSKNLTSSTSAGGGMSEKQVDTGAAQTEQKQPLLSGDAVTLSYSDAASDYVGKPDSSMEDNSNASVIIMVFFSIPVLLLIGIGALMTLWDRCCREKEAKGFSQLFPPSAGFEKLRMEDCQSDNSDTETEEYNESVSRKAST